MKQYTKPLSLRNVQVNDKFWKEKMELVRKEVIPYQWDALNDKVEGAAPSFCMRNFKVAGKLRRLDVSWVINIRIRYGLLIPLRHYRRTWNI